MPSISVEPEAVISRLASQIGHLHAELAGRDAALEAAHARIAELETSLTNAAADEMGG